MASFTTLTTIIICIFVCIDVVAQGLTLVTVPRSYIMVWCRIKYPPSSLTPPYGKAHVLLLGCCLAKGKACVQPSGTLSSRG